jgi:predicted XRE-type DNA-binding protein
MSKIVESSGNVFQDIGFTPAEAANLKLRADLMLQVRQVMRERNLTQIAAAKLFGVTQPRVSDLVRGKLHVFTIDALVAMLARAGVNAQIEIVPFETFVELLEVERKFIEAWGVESAMPSFEVPDLFRQDDANSGSEPSTAVNAYALCA